VTLIALTAAALSFTAWAIASAPRQSAQAPQTGETKRKTLRDIAHERDVEVQETEGELDGEYDDLRRLAKHAEAIVVARVTDAQSSFTDGSDFIFTTYQLDVRRVVKDMRLSAPLMSDQPQPASLSTPLKLVRLGGTVQVNGYRATQAMKGGDHFKPGKDLLLFLWWSPNFNAYYLAGGVSGAFLVGADERLSPLGTKAEMLRYKGGGLQAVIDEILAAQ
jgi:hypothetical protein